MNGTISIITVCFNAEKTIAAALSSVQQQTYGQIEHVIVDGASTDRTLEIVNQYASKTARILSEPDGGIYDAFNKGLRISTGDVIGFLHADDVFEDANVLSAVSDAFSDPRVQVVYGDLVYVSAANNAHVVRRWRSGVFHPWSLRTGWMPAHPTLYVRRSVYDQIGEFDVAYRIAGDYDSILRIFSLSDLCVVYVRKVFVRMGLGGVSNRSPINIIRKSIEDYRALKAAGIGGFVALLMKNARKLPQFF